MSFRMGAGRPPFRAGYKSTAAVVRTERPSRVVHPDAVAGRVTHTPHARPLPGHEYNARGLFC
jgi:hypothetical protein